ncbi:MAG: hypothetical protein KY461_03250 [Actinobacteria bacterium]|nr:hypothetical protein [Actinomycetota bacterium]
MDPRRHARRGALLLAFAAWNWWLWGTRTWNLLAGDERRTAGFVAVHLALYATSLAVATAVGVLGWRMRAEARAGGEA